jgi:hypothetical protein
MATTTPGHQIGAFGSQSRFLGELSAGTGTESIGGAAAVVLAILGLAGIEPTYMVAIATIVVGAALIVEGAAMMAKQAEMVVGTGAGVGERMEGGSGLTAEFLGGAAGIVLAILALVHIYPTVLLAVAALVFGASLLLGAGLTARVRTFEFQPASEHAVPREVGREAAVAGTGAQALVALAAVVLGILALVHIAPEVLTLVAMLILGASVLLSGSTMTTRMLAGIGRR